MRKQFELLDMPAERWRAVDGRDLDMHLDLEDFVREGVVNPEAVPRILLPDKEKHFGGDLTPGALGCALSHLQIWKELAARHGAGDEESVAWLVLEDDCRFLPGFSAETLLSRLAEVPDDWEIVFLGGLDTLGMLPHLQVTPGVSHLYAWFRQTTAYVLRPAGARAALEVCTPLMWQLDTHLAGYHQFQEEPPAGEEDAVGHLVGVAHTTKPMGYCLYPPLVDQARDEFPTDVQLEV